MDAWLRSHGYIPYQPVADCAHPFDRLVASANKQRIFIADAKAKAARKHYPDTGIDVVHYNDYQRISKKHNMHVFIFFVDEDRAQIYGNFLAVLDLTRIVNVRGRPTLYPLVQKGIRYWPLEAMRLVGKIPQEDVERLQALSTRNEAYQ